ncbi:MAG: tRNA (adenosine(37)-N6)-dimethylallyltransferase MiaA [Rhodospirillaceae bacterium]|nr:MAG: tRNA (adenosine(37)-N6)-dimethylallyltransferase MiaA [Rhodospirillaceae bacterium]
MPTQDQEKSGEGFKAIIIAGPTACGKSALAMDVAEHFGGTVINADSQQVYKELCVLSARPSVEDEKRVPHRLFGTMEGHQICSAGHWVDMAVVEVQNALKQGRLPILVGGTGMYLQSLTEGLSPIPAIPAHVRTQSTARHKELGAEAFHEELGCLDSLTAERLPIGDTQRLLRAWEVTIFTGRTFSSWQDEPRIKPLPDVQFSTIAITPPREELYAAIDARFERMVQGGGLDEVKALKKLDLSSDLPLMKALGVPQLLAYLADEISLEEAIQKSQKLSRNYAKRQLTWVRNQIEGSYRLDAQYSKRFSDKIFSFIHEFLLTGAT